MKNKKPLPLSQVYKLLEPGPVVLLTTVDKKTLKPNVMTMSWHTMLDFEPPQVGIVVSDRDYSFHLLKSAKQCVLNIPTTKIAKQVVACGNTTGRTSDKFKKFKLTPIPATQVKAPIIDECYAALECKVIDTSMVKKYVFFVVEVVKAWVDPKVKNPKTLHHRGNGYFMIAGPTIKISSKMR